MARHLFIIAVLLMRGRYSGCERTDGFPAITRGADTFVRVGGFVTGASPPKTTFLLELQRRLDPSIQAHFVFVSFSCAVAT